MGPSPAPAGANEQWTLDFLQDGLASGRKIQLLGILGVGTREALALEVDTNLPGSRVVQVLDRLAGERERSGRLVLDNGAELISRALEASAHERAVTRHCIDPGKPIPNAHGENVHGRLRDECLNENRFLGLKDARRIVEAWRQGYNRERPHSALPYQAPEEFPTTGASQMVRRPFGRSDGARHGTR